MKQETREEVKELCSILGGTMLDGVDNFNLKGTMIALSETRRGNLMKETLEQYEKACISFGKYLKEQELLKFIKGEQ